MKKAKQKLVPLKITHQKYLELVQTLQNLKVKRANLSQVAKEANENIADDPWHSNARKDFLNELRQINEKIASLLYDLNRAEIIEKTNHYKRVNIGDVVRIRCTFLGEEPEEMMVRLVSYIDGKKDRYQNGVMSISITSDLGKAIYEKLIGEVQSFGNGNQVEILEKEVSKDVVNVGDVIEVIHQEQGFYPEPRLLLLVEQIPKESVKGIEYVSIREPLGKAIYSHAVGDEISYQIGTISHRVQILSCQPFQEEKKKGRLLHQNN